MQIRAASDAPASVTADAIVVPVFAGGAGLTGPAHDVDAAAGGALAEALAAGEIAGKPLEHVTIHVSGKPFRKIFAVGVGAGDALTATVLSRAAGLAIRQLGKRGAKTIAFALPASGIEAERAAAAIAEGAIAGTQDATTYRTEPDKPVQTETVVILGGAHDAAAVARGLERGRIMGTAVNHARVMALTPANDMTPTHLAARAKELAADAGLQFDVLDEARMAEKGMGLLLGVSAGSDQPATLSVMTYRGDPGSNETIALVGKGLTFDSGGISIKPAENMHEMKYDMSGGAGVIAAMWAIGKLAPKVNVIGLIPSSENLPGGKAVKPGDVLRGMNGKTVEVINTDAEGRLILADALCYARELGATRLVDCATLTGACVIALGHAASGTMSNDEAFVNRFLEVTSDVGERYWRLPLFDEYEKQIKSDIADLKNTGGRPAGSETAGLFLKHFVAGLPWIHLDIAGTAYLEESPYLAKGPTGTPVRALVALVDDLARNGAPAAATNGKVAAAV